MGPWNGIPHQLQIHHPVVVTFDPGFSQAEQLAKAAN